jgi:hypothetical protein
MKNFPAILFLVLATGCTKQKSGCNFPTYACLQGKWIEKVHTDSSSPIKEYIQVYSVNNREILYDETFLAQVQMTDQPLGEYYFEELAHQDSVALTPAWKAPSFHRYLKMVNENEIEIDYFFPPGPPLFKKKYIRD